jgi:hypothetical protein
MADLEQPSGDSAAVVDTAPPETTGDAPEIQFDEATGLPLVQQTVDDDIEEEVDGVKLKGKKDAVERVKAERLMNKDYTQKTQATAEERRALEADRAQFAQATQDQQQHIREVAQLVAIDDRLAQFQNVNWAQLTDQDPVQALKLHTEFTQLQAARGQLSNTLTQKQQAQQQERQRANAKQQMEARQVVERDIKNWPEVGPKVHAYVTSQGIPPEVAERITQPAMVKLLHQAYLYAQLEKQRTVKPPAAPAPPATRVSGGGAVSTKEPAQMSDAEFAAWRRRQIAQRRP